MIVIGTTVGAGMLALPLTSAAAGFTASTILLLALWVLTIASGFMIIEVNLALPIQACSFSSMAEKTLGSFGKIITWITYLLLMYAATCAYISGAASLITNVFDSFFALKIPIWINTIIFTLVLGSAVFWSTSSVDYVNRGLLSTKGILLFITLILVLPHIDVSQLYVKTSAASCNYLWGALPIFICALCYHIVVPSLRIYVGDKPQQLKWIIVIGSGTALLIYLLWLAATLGVVPLTGTASFTTIANSHGSVGELVRILSQAINRHSVSIFINAFANIAMTTSFLGVSLSLFDFLADGCKRPNTRFGRMQTACLTFIPPLIFAICYPKGFLTALNYAGVFVAMLSLVLPALMLYKLRKHATLKSSYRTKVGYITMAIAFVVGIIIVSLPLLMSLNLVPTLH